MRLQVARHSQQHAIAIDDMSGLADEQRTIRIAVKRHSEARAFGEHAFLQSLQMQRSAAGIDVSSIGIHARGH